MSLSAIPRALREAVFQRDRGSCRYCRLQQIGQGSVFHINHVVPRSRGGATDAANLVLQCPSCSLHKANKITSIDPVTGGTAALFHPLVQRWADHFDLASDGSCHGQTPVGRATVEALQMNNPLPKIARFFQIQTGLLFPSFR